MEITIRNAKTSDFDAIHSLHLELERAELPFDSNLKENCYLDKRCIDRIKKDLNSKYVKYIVAVVHDKIVGFLAGEVLDRWFYKEKVAYLSYLCVDPSFRNNGIAQLLLNKFENMMRDNGVKYVRLNTFTRNKSAIGFYLKNGFDEYSIYYQKEI